MTMNIQSVEIKKIVSLYKNYINKLKLTENYMHYAILIKK